VRVEEKQGASHAARHAPPSVGSADNGCGGHDDDDAMGGIPKVGEHREGTCRSLARIVEDGSGGVHLEQKLLAYISST
jgi:hypothetical protein